MIRSLAPPPTTVPLASPSNPLRSSSPIPVYPLLAGPKTMRSSSVGNRLLTAQAARCQRSSGERPLLRPNEEESNEEWRPNEEESNEEESSERSRNS